jgi:hypothetical protein
VFVTCSLFVWVFLFLNETLQPAVDPSLLCALATKHPVHGLEKEKNYVMKNRFRATVLETSA